MLREDFKRKVFLAPAYKPPAQRASVNGHPVSQNQLTQWIETAAYRKAHPCHYVDFSQWRKRASCGCKCGTVYVCKTYGECAITHNKDCQVRSCVFCPTYTERIELPAASQQLTIPVGVTTCPVIRNGKIWGYRDTLLTTLLSIKRAGWEPSDVTIFAEPESAVPSGWRTVWNQRRLEPWSNLYAGLRHQRSKYPEADCYLMMEDDTWLARNTKAEIERRGLPRDPQWGIVRVFRMSGRGHPWRQSDVFCESRRTDGYQKVRTGEYLWGTNAVLFSPLAVDRMLADTIDNSQEDSPDLKIGRLMIRYGFSEWCCNPSLAQTDTSKPSAVGHGQSAAMESDTFVEDAFTVQEMYA